MSMKRLVVCMLVLCMSMLYCAAALGEEEITIRYSYWGSSYENDAMQKIAASYEALHPNVHIVYSQCGIHNQDDGYDCFRR